MAPWWHNIIKLWEIPDATALDIHKRPGIHYVVKRAHNTFSLLDNLGEVLERGMRGNCPPAGPLGRLHPNTVDLGFSPHEIDELLINGYNPIIIRHGIPYVWGQKFFNNDRVHKIADRQSGLTPEFRKFIAKPLLGIVPNTTIDQEPPVSYTSSEKALHRAVAVRPKAFGLITLQSRAV